jgi:hypothetical protein
VCLDGEGHDCREEVDGCYDLNRLRLEYYVRNPTGLQREMITRFENTAGSKFPGGLRGDLKWKWDKETMNQSLTIQRLELDENSRDTTACPNLTSTVLRSTLTISCSKESGFDESFIPVLTKIRRKSSVMEVIELINALQHLSKSKEDTPIVVGHTAILGEEFIGIEKELANYAHAGGTVIFLVSNESCSEGQTGQGFQESVVS